MIPENNDGLQIDFQFAELPTNTFMLRISRDIITGMADRVQAMVQAIYLILNIERYDYLIYSWNYGVEFSDLFGQPVAFCIPEIRRRITEALMQDSRITGVDQFEFDHARGVVNTTFLVHTIYGDIEAERSIEI